MANHSRFQVHTSASVDIEDLPSGWNKISVELLAQDLSQPMLYGSELLRDEVSFFVLLREGDAGPGSQGGEALRLMPPSAPIVIGRYSASHLTVQLALFSSPCELSQHCSTFCAQRFSHRTLPHAASLRARRWSNFRTLLPSNECHR